MHYADALRYLDDHASYEKTGRIVAATLTEEGAKLYRKIERHNRPILRKIQADHEAERRHALDRAHAHVLPAQLEAAKEVGYAPGVKKAIDKRLRKMAKRILEARR